jgi:excisionase family DNA binding protein
LWWAAVGERRRAPRERGDEVNEVGRSGGQPGVVAAAVEITAPAVVPSTGARVYRQLFDRESLAEYLRLSTDTVDRLVKAGKLPCVRIGAQVRFTLDDVERFIASNRCAGPGVR